MTTPQVTLPPSTTPDKYGGDPVAFDTAMQAWLTWMAAQAAQENTMANWMNDQANAVASGAIAGGGIAASVSTATAMAQAAAAYAQQAAAAWVASMAPAEVLPTLSQSLHIGAVVKAIVYDTSKDSDGGAWRKRCQDKSWYTEALGGDRWIGQQATIAAAWTAAGSTTGAVFQASATAGPITSGKYYAATSAATATEVFRGINREFPAVAAIVVEAARVVIYDLSAGGCPMWMVFVGSPSNGHLRTTVVAAVAAINGQLCVGSNGDGLFQFNLVSDKTLWVYASGTPNTGYLALPISGRNVLQTRVSAQPYNVVSYNVNDVAITVLPDAPIDPATGLPTPTIAVATAGGVSVIKQDGTVVNGSDTHSTWSIGVTKSNELVYGALQSLQNGFRVVNLVGISSGFSGRNYNGISAPFSAANLKSAVWKDYIAGYGNLGSAHDGITVLKENPAVPAAGMFFHITNSVPGCWQVGDSRGAFLADTTAETITGGTQPDRSVKNVALNVNGTLTKSAVATAAALVAYAGFSAANYLEQPYNANLDFGTGDCAVMGWAIPSNVGGGDMFSRSVVNQVSPFADLILIGMSSTAIAFRTGASTRSFSVTPSVGSPYFIVAMRISGIAYLYVNGVLAASSASSDNLTSTTAITRLGLGTYTSALPFQGSLALWRIGATAPSADQIAHIYRTELPLFQSNAQCTIAGLSTSVTTMAYDDTTDMLHVGTSWGRTSFKDLLRVDSEATTTGALTSLSAQGGIILTGGTSAKVYVPAKYLRDELKRKDEARAALGKVPVFFDFTATASQVAFALPKGYTTKALYKNGTLMRETTTGVYWTRSNDGFLETCTLSVGANAGDWISVMATRNY